MAGDGVGETHPLARRIGAVATARWLPVAAALLLGAVAAAESWTHAARTDPRQPLLIAIIVLLGLASTVPVAVSGTHPVPAASLIAGALLVSVVAAGTLTYAGVAAQLLTGYRVGERTTSAATPPPDPSRSRSRLARLSALLLAAPFPLLALIALSGSVAVSQTRPVTAAESTTAATAVTMPDFVVPLGLLALLAPIAALAGITRRSAREAAAGRVATAAAADSFLEHTARGERARIARELHDVVAHHISMVAVQAETARLATPGMPEAGARRLRDIGDTARAALTEMRRLLGVLREDTGDDPPRLTPQPGLGIRELNALIDSARAASDSAVRLILTGTPSGLDPGVELAAYRIIQEALTNARRHAPGSAVDVTLSYTSEELVVTVRDNGPGPPDTPATGLGLTGMRERASAVGGDLRIDTAAGGGCRVELRLPIPGEATP